LPINSQFTRQARAAAPNPARLSAAVAELFPPGVAAAELRQPGDSSLLYPEEAAGIARAVPERASEFTAGRLCARRALAEFGIAGFALEMGLDRAPVWPGSMVGSITHTRGFCAAVVGERGRFSSLGLDVEAAGGVKRELWERICLPAELAWLESLPVRARGAAATLVFSAKEAFYKCQYPVTRERLRFADLCVSLPEPGAAGVAGTADAAGAAGSVAVVLATPTRPLAIAAAPGGGFRGSYRMIDGYLAAGFHLP
jgi:4'-phosphopantetheinyl transferase EntD